MSYNLIFIDESESMQRAVAAVFLNDPEFKFNLVDEPSSLYKAAKNFNPDIIVLSYNTIDTGLKKSITEIKTSREFSDIPLILLVPSDLSDNERETLIKLKVDGFIYRPFDKDTFISKIKRTLSGSSTISNSSENTANAENPRNTEEKIYNIASFENKKTNEAPNFFYSTESPDAADNKEQGSSSLESSELSQAFENLFKDDAIFKEFQNLNKLNKKEEPGGTGYVLGEETPAQTAEVPNAELISGLNETKNEAQTALSETLSETIKQEEPAAAPAETAELESIAAAMPEEILGAAEPPEPDNTAIHTKKSEGELNLKILDEQNLVKLNDYLKNAIEKTLEEIKPQIIETIKTGLPEIIERLVKEEIEKIKQQ